MTAPRHPIVWGPEAAADLSDIWDYYAQVAARRSRTTLSPEFVKLAAFSATIRWQGEPAMKSAQGFDAQSQPRILCFIGSSTNLQRSFESSMAGAISTTYSLMILSARNALDVNQGACGDD